MKSIKTNFILKDNKQQNTRKREFSSVNDDDKGMKSSCKEMMMMIMDMEVASSEGDDDG